jgi:hypothetical protein
MQSLDPKTIDVIDEAKQEVQADKDRARVMRHFATKPVRVLPTLLTPEKRAYMKRFGSRPAKKAKTIRTTPDVLSEAHQDKSLHTHELIAEMRAP